MKKISNFLKLYSERKRDARSQNQKTQMQKWKERKGEKRLCRSNDSENEEFQSRERDY